jgi:para-aminobenzoate synthetase component 1
MEVAEHRFWMGGLMASELMEVSSDPDVLNDGNFWAVATTFEGDLTFIRFAHITNAEFPQINWDPGHLDNWQTTIDREGYCAYVEQIRTAIAEGNVYQVNACRQIFHESVTVSLAGLFSQILLHNPAPFASYLSIPGLEIASASPELFLSREGKKIKSSPIKGTKKLGSAVFGDKDQSENIMIVDLMRNDLGQICEAGSIDVENLLRSEEHPGLTHLVSDVVGNVRNDFTWSSIFKAILPPGSVSGAPKSSALTLISTMEKSPRSYYCGALGWVHGDRAVLSVAIRTFFKSNDDVLRFGTGAGITWGSEPYAEWEETELKAKKLISIAGGKQ